MKKKNNQQINLENQCIVLIKFAESINSKENYFGKSKFEDRDLVNFSIESYCVFKKIKFEEILKDGNVKKHKIICDEIMKVVKNHSKNKK